MSCRLDDDPFSFEFLAEFLAAFDFGDFMPADCSLLSFGSHKHEINDSSFLFSVESYALPPPPQFLPSSLLPTIPHRRHCRVCHRPVTAAAAARCYCRCCCYHCHCHCRCHHRPAISVAAVFSLLLIVNCWLRRCCRRCHHRCCHCHRRFRHFFHCRN